MLSQYRRNKKKKETGFRCSTRLFGSTVSTMQIQRLDSDFFTRFLNPKKKKFSVKKK